MKLRDKIFVSFCFLFITVLGISLSFANKKFNNETQMKSKYQSITGDFGEWELASYLTSNSSNVEINDNKVTYYKNSDSLSDNEVELHFNTYVKNSYIDTVSAGTILYYVNTSSLFFYDFDYGNFEIDATENKVKFLDNEGETKGYIRFGQDMPYCDFDNADFDISGCTGNADYYWLFNSYGLMIINGKDITNLSNYSVDLTVTYALDSEYYMIQEENEILNGFELLDYSDSYIDYDPIFAYVEERVDNIDVSDIHSEEEIEYTSWQNEWGNNSSTYDYYIVYPVVGNINYNDNYNVSFTLSYDDGEVLSYSSNGYDYYMGNAEDFANAGICNFGYVGEFDFSCYVVVGYNAPNDKTVGFNIEVNVSTNNEDKDLSFNWNHFLPAKGSGYTPEYPSGISNNISQKNNNLTAGEGAINKLNNNSSVTFSWLMESGSSNITNSYKAFNLWNAIVGDSYTVSISSDKTELDNSYSMVSNPTVLSSSDYNIVSFYPQDDVEYDYILNNNSYTLNPVSDYSSYSQKEVYVSINNGDYELIGTYINNGSSIVYTANDNRTTSNNDVSQSNPVVLPNNVSKVKVTYTGNRAAIYLGINIDVLLKGTANVQSVITNLGDDVILKNVAAVQVNDNNVEYDRIGTYLTKLEVRSYANSSSTVNERINDGRTDLISYQDSFYEQLDYTEETKSEAMNILSEQKNGIVYELLPEGAELNGNVTVQTIGNNGSCSSTSEPVDTYNGLNRSLIKITIGDCSNNYYDTGSSIQSGYKITFDITYDALANQSFGTTLNKDVMYVGSASLGDGYNSTASAPDNVFSSNSVKTVFDSLVNGNHNLLFATNTTTVESMSISVGTYSKGVKNSLETNYSSSTSVVESNKYTYKLQYAFASDLEQITNVVFVDKLESDYGNNPHFSGYIKNYITDIDISNLTSMGVDAKVYYAVGNVNIDMFDITEWSETAPDDPTNLKAIAVVCGSYVFEKSSNAAPTVYVNMIAPNTSQENLKAYNKSKIFYKRVGDSELKILESDSTTVSLNKANISVDGTSNYGKGSSTNPALIEGDLSYQISVTNNDSNNSFDNVVVEVDVPGELNVVNPASTNNKVQYTISHLNASETKTFDINLELAGPVSSDKVLKATYKIISLNGKDYNGTEGNIYNKVALPEIEAHKYAKTSDLNTFSDVADMIVKENEEFSYRVSITNKSGINATNVKVVDTVPDGLSVINSTLGNGTLSGNKITWYVDVSANSTLNIDYKVKINDGAVLGTSYRSSAHVSLVNPLLSTDMLYDEDTNVISVLYQISSSVKVTNTLSGNLADSNKQFEYTIELNGTSVNAGSYNVFDSKNNSLQALNLDENGSGSYSFKLKGNESITFKNLTGGINYTIKQKTYDGYTTSANNSSTSNGYVVVSGNTNEEGTLTYAYTNAYSANGSATVSAKVTYDKGVSANMFKVSVDGVEYDVNSDGNIPAIEKNYNNEVGQFTYIIKQINTNLPKISYDNKEYKAIVNVTDNKDGTLKAEVKYYDNSNKEVNDVVFNNSYLPNGLKISNVNNSDYIDQSKVFSYFITLTGGEGTYTVKDNKGNELSGIEFVNGTADYNVSLLSNESIIIVDLPDGVNYTIKQNLFEHYKSTSNEEFVLEEDNISVTGTTIEGSKEIVFENRYDTEATFEPVIKVKLEGKTIEKDEFNFKLLDVSEGSTNGNVIQAKNDAEGNVTFGEIKYTRPGTYKYEIVQLDNGSNHVYFDFSKVILILELTDNGDGTMKVLGTYQYENEEEYLLNKYSVEPIVKEEEQQENPKTNPNTKDRIRNIVVLLVTVIILLFVERWVRHRRFTMGV